MRSVGHLVNRRDCLKESFDPGAALNYAGVTPEQLAVVTGDLFYISTWNRRLCFGSIQTLFMKQGVKTPCQTNGILLNRHSE